MKTTAEKLVAKGWTRAGKKFFVRRKNGRIVATIELSYQGFVSKA